MSDHYYVIDRDDFWLPLSSNNYLFVLQIKETYVENTDANF